MAPMTAATAQRRYLIRVNTLADGADTCFLLSAIRAARFELQIASYELQTVLPEGGITLRLATVAIAAGFDTHHLNAEAPLALDLAFQSLE